MVKYNLKGMVFEELSYKQRYVSNLGQKVDIKPHFSRQVRQSNSNDMVNVVALTVTIESTEEEPKPFDIHITLSGIFEFESKPSKKDEHKFVVETTQMLFPYLRAAVTNLTAQAYIAPLNLPVITEPLFPEDKNV